MITCNSKSQVQADSNAKSADSSVNQLQITAAVFAMSKSISIMWAPGLRGLTGDELADNKA